MKVTKKEAKQIGLFGSCIVDKNYNYLMITHEDRLIFDYFAGSEQDILDYEDEYKIWEWRNVEEKDLQQGDVIKFNRDDCCRIYVYDKYTFSYYIDDEGRPQFDCLPYYKGNIYKLFRKDDK